jgi:transposase
MLQWVLQELIRQAAQGEVVHNDDTGMRVLTLERDAEISAKRTGVFTSGIVSIAEGHRMALFFTGCKRAGENLADVLKKRAAELPPPIQMCDALSRNVPKLPASLETLRANCNAHGRRNFVKVIANFPEECRFVLESLGKVYHHGDEARVQKLSAEERLRFHQEHSGPVMKELHDWLDAQFQEKQVEPNSGLGKAIAYLLRHWEKLTLFLKEPGALSTTPASRRRGQATSGGLDALELPAKRDSICRPNGLRIRHPLLSLTKSPETGRTPHLNCVQTVRGRPFGWPRIYNLRTLAESSR